MHRSRDSEAKADENLWLQYLRNAIEWGAKLEYTGLGQTGQLDWGEASAKLAVIADLSRAGDVAAAYNI